MRPELKGLSEDDYWVYGIGPEDLDYTLKVARSLMEASFELFRQEAERVRASDPEHADDTLDDVGYYTYVEAQYLWQFCLWRMQGILESVIANRLLRNASPLGRRVWPGLKAKLDALRLAGYTISDTESTELLDWAAVRNALSHAPPEQYRPGPLTEGDVVDYRRLVGGLLDRWLGENPRVRGVDSEADA